MLSRDRLSEALRNMWRALLAWARHFRQAAISRGLPVVRSFWQRLVALTRLAAACLAGWLARRGQAVDAVERARAAPVPELPLAPSPPPLGATSKRRRLWLVLWVLLALVGLTTAGAFIAWAGWQHMLTAPLPESPDNQVFVVSPGQSTTRIAENLHEAGLIRHPLVFRLWARQTGHANRLQAGEYRLSADMSAQEIMDKLVKGQVILYPVTIPEGYTIRQIEELLINRGLVQREPFQEALAEAAAGDLLPPEFRPQRQHLVLESLEGYLFPDTYHFPRGVTEREIVRAMISQLKAVFTPELLARAEELGLTVSEVLTLGSIIEKEARVADERPLMSGVFHNRMRIRMPLQADPTVRYVMPDPKAPITPREWAIDSPYNTYVYRGLPPGPISAVGEASIIAALYPAETEYFYFVARPDGSHAFARTYLEHVANVRRYIR